MMLPNAMHVYSVAGKLQDFAESECSAALAQGNKEVATLWSMLSVLFGVSCAALHTSAGAVLVEAMNEKEEEEPN